jgi:hypothetical protein
VASVFEPISTMPRVTHFRAEGNALHAEDGKFPEPVAAARCSGCGSEFEITRPWQKHCSSRCRVRVHRQAATAEGYYGA